MTRVFNSAAAEATIGAADQRLNGAGLILTDESTAEPSAIVLPPVLVAGVREQYEREFLGEYTPVGPTEFALVRALARHAAGLERWGLGSEAVAREAARALLGLTLTPADGDSAELADRLLAGAMSTEAAQQCERHLIAHARGLHRSLEKLREIQAQRKRNGVALPPPPFANETACERYLVDRFQAGQHPCDRCGSAKGHYLATRRCWECAQCKQQIGIRTGTVMARSAVPLLCWFEAVRWILWRPTISTSQLSGKLGIHRPTTVRTISRRVRDALAQEDASMRLAGLDLFYAKGAYTPEPGVRNDKCESPQPCGFPNSVT